MVTAVGSVITDCI